MKKVRCKNCRKKMDYNAFTLEHGYGSPYDMEIWEFCSIQCLLIYIIKKITEEKE